MARQLTYRTSVSATRVLVLGTFAGPLLFTLGWLVLGFVSPGYTVFGEHIAPYDPVAQPISGLGMGVTATAMNTAFVLGGVLLLAGVLAAFRELPAPGSPRVHWAVAALLSLSPLGMLLAGFFDLEQPLPHLAGFLLCTATPVVGFVVAGLHLRRVPGARGAARVLLCASPVVLVLLVAFFAGFDQATTAANEGLAGVTSRVLGIVVHLGYVALGWAALRRAG